MILVSILGDVHSSILPVFFEFKDKISKHILVYDPKKYDKAKVSMLMNGQKVFMETYSDYNYELSILHINSNSYDDIFNSYVDIVKSVKPSDIFLNATGAMGSIGLVLSSNLLQDGGNVISYDQHQNKYNLHSLDGLKHKKIRHNLDILTHLQLKGYKVLEYVDNRELQSRKSAIFEMTSNLIKFKRFADLHQKYSTDEIEGYHTFKKNLKKIGKSNDKLFIQGGVFEEYIYHLLVDHLEFDDVMVGVKVEFSKGVNNELDILMIKDNHLHTIECKFVNNLNGEHYVYKSSLLMNYLDDEGKAMILSVDAKNTDVTTFGNKKRQFTKGDRARAHNGDIKIHQTGKFGKDVFIQDVKQWFCH